jgi:hypothetical protein
MSQTVLRVNVPETTVFGTQPALIRHIIDRHAPPVMADVVAPLQN